MTNIPADVWRAYRAGETSAVVNGVEVLLYSMAFGDPPVPKHLPAWERIGGWWNRGVTAAVAPVDNGREGTGWDAAYYIAGDYQRSTWWSGQDWGRYYCDAELVAKGHVLEGGPFPAPDGTP